MNVAGSPDRLFIGYYADADPQILQALANQPSGEPIEVMVGGQLTTLVPRYLVSTHAAQTAALHFLGTGKPSPEIAWERI